MASSMPALDLPLFYYHDHFMEMLDFVYAVCADCLTDEARHFTIQLRALPHAQRCLYIRMANRKGQIFHRRQLIYAELGDCESLCLQLIEAGLARRLEPADHHTLLQLLTKSELIELSLNAELETIRASWSKPKLLEQITRHLNHADLGDVWPLEHYIVQAETAALDYLLFLYFGRGAESLKAFALRDLGIVQANNRHSFQSRFDDLVEAQFCFACLRIRVTLDAGQTADAAQMLEALTAAPTVYAAAQQHRVSYKVGQALEREGDITRALDIYRLSSGPDCRERLVRLLWGAGAHDEAKALLECMIDDPGSDGEFAFANDFYRRKFKGDRISAMTSLLRQGAVAVIDDIHRGAPEFGMIATYKRDGWWAYFTENHFWHQLFGLVFWDELFGGGATSSNEFELLPRALIKKTFWTQSRHTIEAKLIKIKAGQALLIVLKTISAALGQANGLFNWDYLDIEAIRDFLQFAPATAQAQLLRAMAMDFTAHRDGFPDLMLVKDGMLKFAEVKAEGDSIRRNQMTRLQQLKAAGLSAEILQVHYRYDPQQTYVVVDIETTGSRAQAGGITEIGAIKIRDNKVIDEWHSLIRPRMRIPAFITSLTGISDAMVKDAPRFAEIADDLSAFLDDAIFVAHNVNFDYGFICAEFSALGTAYRAPKFCTVTGMRRYYPGHKSYGLGNICALVGIDLENHHRALDDARAASELLMMINSQRMRLDASTPMPAIAVQASS